MEKSFRLLDLPAEIRDSIYHEILCTWSTYPVQWNGDSHELSVPKGAKKHKIETAILRTNRQVYQEAKTVLLTGNQFIRVVVWGMFPYETFIMPNNLPVLTLNNKKASDEYKGFVMTHTIDISYDPDEVKSPDEVVILRRDLDLFVQTVAQVETPFPELVDHQSKHQVTIHNLFVGTLTPHYLDRKNQESLLEQYRKRLSSFKHFQIDGEVNAELADAITTEIMKERALDPQNVVKWTTYQKEIGNRYYREGNSEPALNFWSVPANHIWDAGDRPHWPLLKAAGGKEFEDKITELLFLLNSNRVQAEIKLTEKARPFDLAQNVQGAHIMYSMAFGAAQRLKTDWIPSREQLAKLNYRLAMLFRIGDGDKRLAEGLIKAADEATPGNAAIQREMIAIRTWIYGA